MAHMALEHLSCELLQNTANILQNIPSCLVETGARQQAQQWQMGHVQLLIFPLSPFHTGWAPICLDVPLQMGPSLSAQGARNEH